MMLFSSLARTFSGLSSRSASPVGGASVHSHTYVRIIEDDDDLDNLSYEAKVQKHKALRRQTDAKMAVWSTMRRSYEPSAPVTWDEYVTALGRLHTMFASYLECREARLAEAEAWLAVQAHVASTNLKGDGSMRGRSMAKLLKAKDEVDRLRGRTERGRERLSRFKQLVEKSLASRGVVDDNRRNELWRMSQLVGGDGDSRKGWAQL